MRSFPKAHLNFVSRKQFKSKDAQFIVDFLRKHPGHAKSIRKFCESLENPDKKCMSKEQALNVLVTAKLTKCQYNFIRDATSETGHECFPSYYQVQKAKNECYPRKENIKITDTSVDINLQSLLDKTSERLLQVVDKKQFTNLVLISKWGCDGASDQSQYKISFNNELSDDSSLFACSLVPIKLYDSITGTVIWKNNKPSSTRMCRPISLQFVKETSETINATIEHVNSQVKLLTPSNCTNDTSITHKLCLTMIDGKICNNITKTQSSMRCYICQASPKEMNNLKKINTKVVNEEYYSYGMSSLHAWIRCFECLIHISYNIPFKTWSIRNPESKLQRENRKKEIQNKFRSKLGLLVDIVKQGKGTSNDGNTARTFFSNYQVSSEITDIDVDLIKRIYVILQTISSGQKINIEKFKNYTFQAAELYVNLYNWYYMPASMHKLLMHGAEIIEHAIVPIGLLGEDAQEANHKFIRDYRENYSRKISRIANNEDIIHNMLLQSDPVISSLRSNKTTKHKELLPEALELLEM